MNEYNDFVDRITTLLNTLDTTRVELCELHKQMSEYQSDYDKNDQTYLHKLEILDAADYKKAQEFINDWKSSRSNRRNIKDLITVVANTIDAIPYKNYANALPVLKGSTYCRPNNNNGIIPVRGYRKNETTWR